MRAPLPRSGRPRRGLTLLEMLVVVALVVLMMTALVQIFSAATGAISMSRTDQELGARLRQLDTTIRRDLSGVTAKMTPPLNPKDNLGYFEYGENGLADAQLEDADDYMAFTAKAPDGQPFTGRMWVLDPPVGAGLAAYRQVKPVTITSQYAEIIYFLRNGNLYRRVLLIAPEKQAAVSTLPSASMVAGFPATNLFGAGLNAGWFGVNDLSARPSMRSSGGVNLPPVLNTLGDLTNRQNRFARPRFCDDYFPFVGGSTDGIADDSNGDGLPDYYPTLFPAAFLVPPPDGLVNWAATPGGSWLPPGGANALHHYAFPFVYPWAYTLPDGASSGTGSWTFGWLHGADVPLANLPNGSPLRVRVPQVTNHAPLESGTGDSLPLPVANTWWGFPTWRETASSNWLDPIWSINLNGQVQALGLQPRNPAVLPTTPAARASTNFPPPLNPLAPTQPNRFQSTAYPELSPGDPPVNSDNAGSLTFLMPSVAQRTAGAHPNAVWDDDLIMTGVRSFDIKAYDDTRAAYVDLGWGNGELLRTDDPTILTTAALPAVPPAGTSYNRFVNGTPFRFFVNNSLRNTVGETFAHEGRTPPLINDLRFDPQAPQYNVGVGTAADSLPSVVRLRRVWDTWSTDYTNAPARDINLIGLGGFPGIQGNDRPVYPSFPPPYPVPLRGLQITIRVTDPTNERVKVLTIRHDFSDRL